MREVLIAVFGDGDGWTKSRPRFESIGVGSRSVEIPFADDEASPSRVETPSGVGSGSGSGPSSFCRVFCSPRGSDSRTNAKAKAICSAKGLIVHG